MRKFVAYVEDDGVEIDRRESEFPDVPAQWLLGPAAHVQRKGPDEQRAKWRPTNESGAYNPWTPPRPERVQVTYERDGQEVFVEDMEVGEATDVDALRDEFIARIVKRLAGVDADRPTPHAQGLKSLNFQRTLVVDQHACTPFTGRAIFTLPRSFR